MKLITMTGYRRPEYTRQVLDALSQCEGIADWLVVVSIDPGCDEVAEHYRRWTACQMEARVNAERLGLNYNTHSVMDRAAKLTPDVLVHLEDDTVPSPDALVYFEWAVRSVLGRDGAGNVLLASGYNKPMTEPRGTERDLCRFRPIWTPWGWATEKGRLAWLLANWNFKNPKCFTCWFKRHFRRTHREVFPALSRVQNIGYEMGENDRTPDWYERNHRTPWVAQHVARDFGLIER